MSRCPECKAIGELHHNNCSYKAEELIKLIKEADEALWKIQDYYNRQPKEQINNYFGSCNNQGALNIYQLRITFSEKFPLHLK